ncbi:DUF6438 domain-containing protein [Psychroserpens sp. SPM9]|uniref:DUF6438 domain-containing protein n=1 Tax=Psychroserpens sp. SPM9 TaxID=2975598 RepID=UPI0021A85D86|nr:DUF6438 domain-containing protein [Psychroserpens sp. SPM9]MDG5491993.1 DUF6438 domain-containing protein [Psychroserpens sp. SPM9]
MMSEKFIQLMIIVLTLSACNKASQNTEVIPESELNLTKIDSLNTNFEVENYIRKVNSRYKEFELRRIQDFDRGYKSDSLTKKMANQLKITKAFYKTDFDNNGFTDILVIGDNKDCFGETSCSFNSMVLMNFDNDSIKVIDVVKDHSTSIVPVIEKENGQSFLIINTPNQINYKNEKYRDETIDKLIYKYGSFIEVNANPITHNIETIEYSTGPCYGTCPIFQLHIDADKSATFNAGLYNFDKNHDLFNPNGDRTFKTKLSNEKYQEIIELINYLDFENLKNNYWVDWTDDQSCTLKIVYDGGKVKLIKDYGLIGTYGLTRLYELLFELRFNQDWQELTTSNNNSQN